MSQLLDHGKVTRCYLAVVVQPISPAMARALGQSEPKGALVGDVSAKGPAQAGGVERGDIIVELNGKSVNDANELRNTVSMMQPGETVRVKISRNGSMRDLSVKLGELPASKEEAKNQNEDASKEALEGVSVENLDADTPKELGLPTSTKGVVVRDLDPASPKADSGLRRGDGIQEANHRPGGSVVERELAAHR